MDHSITRKVEHYIRDLFKRNIADSLLYHDIEHTAYVAEQARRIGKESGLSEEELNLAVVAAWFHDSGFVTTVQDHEEEGQKIAREFLSSQDVSKEEIDQVLHCIMATRMPQDPGDSMLARVVCDADMAYLSEPFYFERSNLLRKEWKNNVETRLSRKAYYEQTVELFKLHNYFTEFGIKEFSPGKEKNFQMLHKLLEKNPGDGKKGKGGKNNKNETRKLKEENKKLKEKIEKDKMPGRGVESMFRLTARNQINLSSIADNKANILISINSIVLTVLVTIGMGKISDYPLITFPAIIFTATCLVTIIFAILSTRPKISSGKFTKEDIHNKKVNLLFFGNFYNMDMEEYEWAVKEMINDQNYLYTSMINDQYSLGKVISQKYKLLRIAYTVFMIGLILSFMLFALLILLAPS